MKVLHSLSIFQKMNKLNSNFKEVFSKSINKLKKTAKVGMLSLKSHSMTLKHRTAAKGSMHADIGTQMPDLDK